ncbi:MAG: DUF1329 domain-containing protein, partial [Deltaproteobacteria bacterium]|nr:DUF1329 domain-containing protein [Deltaproteobacteria bacterium]
MALIRISLIAIMVTLAIGITTTFAGVSPEEAAKLKTTLNPMGAEIEGNADGMIPPWT